MDISINIHTDAGTTISRELPTGSTPGGWVVIQGEGYPNVTLFAPHEDPAAFWQYLSNVAADMATYVEIYNERG